jgi:uncharacterized membrane protein YqjE
MDKNRYKDLLATLILFGAISIPVSAWLFGKYASQETKEYFAITIIIFLFFGLIFALWKLIRLLID